MRAVVTRVTSASVTIAGEVTGQIGRGFLVLLGVFENENQKMNLNLAAVGGELLVVSQFTLYADTKSRRPGFTGAAKPELAEPLYEYFLSECARRGFPPQHGRFGADMAVASVNDGPVTILFDTDAM